MRIFRTAAILLTVPLLMTACSKPAEPEAEAMENAATAEATDNAMDAGMTADVGNSGVPELTSSGPGVITKPSNVEQAPTPDSKPAPEPSGFWSATL